MHAQPKNILFRQFSDQEGLPNNEFRIIIQDRSGMLWMAGNDGLAKYDGYGFQTFRHSNVDTTTISGNNILALFEDARGRLWVSTLGAGVNVSDPNKCTYVLVRTVGVDTLNLADLLINEICEDADGRFWMASNEGLIILEEREGLFHALDVTDFLFEGSICATAIRPRGVYADDHGRVWIPSTTGLFQYNCRTRTTRCPTDFPGLPVTTIATVTQDREGRIWLSCPFRDGGMYWSDPEQLAFHKFNKIPVAPNNDGVTFTFDMDNRIWAAEFGKQFYGYDLRDSTLFLESSVNSSAPFERFIRQPYVDHTGDVWIPAAGYLIYPYPQGFENYIHPYTFIQAVSAVYGEGDFLWMAYREQGILKLNTKTGEVVRFASTENADYFIPTDHFSVIKRLRSGNLILVGMSRILLLDGKDRLIRVDTLGGTNRAVLEDSKGRIWIGGFSGIHQYSESTGVLDTTRLPRHIGDRRQFIQKIVEDQDGYLWMASDINGLARMQPDTKDILQFLPIQGDHTSLPTSGIDDLVLGSDGMLWLGTDIGLVRVDPHTFDMTLYDHSHGFQSDYLTTIMFDDQGVLWAATHEGISSFDPQTLRVNNYTTVDGMVNRTYFSRSGWKSPDGTLYFGGHNGLVYFNPRHLRKNPATPIMVLDEIQVDKAQTLSTVDLPDQQPLRLSYRNDLLEVSFSGLYYTAPDAVKYQYKMEGLGNEWVDLGSKHAAVFTDLNPGSYVFRARAVSPDGIWSAEDLVIPIEVTPPFYETLWFRILFACLLIGLLFGFIKYRERRLELQKQKEVEISRKISELEKRALQAQMNPHFIYNCMNSIQQFMVIHDFEGAMKYLTRFSRILRAVLNMSALSRVSLSDEIKLIEDYLELENMRFPNKFSYEIRVSPELNVHTVEIPPFFIQPQVENAIRHGLLKKQSQGKLLIRIDKDGQYVKVTVEDNGIGRVAAQSARLDATRESKGLSIVEERLSHMHQSNGVHPFTITDLYDEAKQATGTRVEVFLPLD